MRLFVIGEDQASVKVICCNLLQAAFCLSLDSTAQTFRSDTAEFRLSEGNICCCFLCPKKKNWKRQKTQQRKFLLTCWAFNFTFSSLELFSVLKSGWLEITRWRGCKPHYLVSIFSFVVGFVFFSFFRASVVVVGHFLTVPCKMFERKRMFQRNLPDSAEECGPGQKLMRINNTQSYKGSGDLQQCMGLCRIQAAALRASTLLVWLLVGRLTAEPYTQQEGAPSRHPLPQRFSPSPWATPQPLVLFYTICSSSLLLVSQNTLWDVISLQSWCLCWEGPWGIPNTKAFLLRHTLK